MSDPVNSVEKLKLLLMALPSGPVTDTEEVECLLADCWSIFAGG